MHPIIIVHHSINNCCTQRIESGLNVNDFLRGLIRRTSSRGCWTLVSRRFIVGGNGLHSFLAARRGGLWRLMMDPRGMDASRPVSIKITLLTHRSSRIYKNFFFV